MLPDSLLLVLTNVGIAGVFCVLFILGFIYPRSVVQDLKEENRLLKDALHAERERSTAMVTAAQSTRDVVAAIQAGLQMGQRQI